MTNKDNGGPAFPCEGGRTVMSGNAMHKTLPSDGMKLYAAPVSEAKAQGVYSADPLACSGCASGCFRCRDVAKAQGVVMPERLKPSRYELHDAAVDAWNSCLDEIARLNAAPVQQVSVPECFTKLLHHAHGMTLGADWNKGTMAGYHREPLGEAVVQCQAWLAATPASPAADAWLVEALELAANRLDRLALEQVEFWRGYATAWADEARATANGVKS